MKSKKFVQNIFLFCTFCLNLELNLVKVFILPPSKEELEKRLIARNQDGKESIKNRLLAYSQDITHANEYDHVIINDNVDKCFNEIKKIISEKINIK